MENPEHVLMELNTFEKEPQDNLPKVGFVWLLAYEYDGECGSNQLRQSLKITPPK